MTSKQPTTTKEGSHRRNREEGFPHEVFLRCAVVDEGMRMSNKVRGIVRNGKIELLDEVDLPEGARILLVLLPDDESQFWMEASPSSLDAVWDNPEDDVYAQLLEK